MSDIEVPADPETEILYQAWIGNLWGLTELIDSNTGQHVVLSHIITLVDEPQDGNDGPAGQPGEPG